MSPLRATLVSALLSLPLAAIGAPAAAQSPVTGYGDAFEGRAGRTQPVVHYVVRADAADRSGLAVEVRIRNAPDTLHLRIPVWAPGAYRLANFGRNVRDLTVVGADGRTVAAMREVVAGDSSSGWRAVVPGGSATVRYRVAFPTPAAAASPNNRSFFRETGLLLDGPATYVYLDGQKLAPAHVTLEIPSGWRTVTGLVPTADPRTFFAPTYDVLIDSPVLAGAPGALRVWPFDVDGVPHRVAYWATPSAPAFDSTAFVDAHRRIVRAARGVAGRLPYREYSFLYVDSTGGGLEHLNSTTIGARADALAKDPLASASTTAHEFFHLWNIKRLRPAALGPFDYQRLVRTTSLWWSEGVTDFFAAELLRRSGLVSEQQARERLEGAIQAFLANPAHAAMSPERASWVAWDSPSTYGGYTTGFYYTQGALLGELLELRVRQATGLRRGMDDVLRLLLDRFAGEHGFAGEDVLYAANETCGCDLAPFFAAHVSGADALDFDRELAPLGLRAVIERAQVTDAAGTPAPDLRLGLISFGGTGSAGGAAGGRPRFSVSSPQSAWGKAGLVTGDEAVSVNGKPVPTAADLRAALAGTRVGDTVRVEYLRAGERRSARVTIAPYETVRVTLADLPTVSAAQRAMRRAWMSGTE